MSVAVERPSLWTGRHLRTTIGVFALAFMIAFEALAVATVMPKVAGALDGLSLYAVTFSAPLAVGIVGYAVAGPWVDERGPHGPIDVGVVAFCTGLVVAGAAPTMVIFLVGRAVQGSAPASSARRCTSSWRRPTRRRCAPARSRC